MMASYTLMDVFETFPGGTVVGAYEAANWRTAGLPPSGAPQGSTTTTATVDSGGELAFTGLVAGRAYFAAASVSGTWRYQGFTAPDDTTPSGLDARMDAAEASLVSVESSSATLADEAAAHDAELSLIGRLVRLYPAATQSSIFASAALLAAIGGGEVMLPVGKSGATWAKIALTAPLPLYRGVKYRGVLPAITPISGRREQDFDFVGGTVFEGDGTFRGVDFNSADAVSPPDTDGASGISGVALTGIGFENFTDGVRIGAKNVFGLHLGGEIDQVYVKRCTGWGFDLWNCTAVEIGYVRASAFGVGGYRERVDMSRAGGSPWNHRIGHVYVNVPRVGDDIGNGQTCPDSRLVRGIAFESANGGGTAAVANELTISRLQANRFNTALLSVTATITASQQAIDIPDGTKFKVGMPVSFTASSAGFTAGLCYTVRSVAGNQITLALGRSSNYSVITPSGSTTLTLTSYGFANLAILSLDDSSITNIVAEQIDVEGTASAGVYLEGTSNCHIRMGDSPGVVGIAQVVGRQFAYGSVTAGSPITNDMDSASATSTWVGARNGFVNYRLRGHQFDSARGVNGFSVAAASGAGLLPDLEFRAGSWLYPGNGIGRRIYHRDASIAPTGAQAGLWICKPTSTMTVTLPTVAADGATPSAQLGLDFEFRNVGTASVVVNTDGTQLFNKVGGATSITVPPGAGARVVGADDSAGTRYWYASTQIHAADHATGGLDPITPAAIGATPAGTIAGKTVPTPGASEDQKTWLYDHSTGAMVWTSFSSGSAAPNASQTVKGITKVIGTISDATNPQARSAEDFQDAALAADLTITNSSLQNITGLGLAVGASATEVWLVKFWMLAAMLSVTVDCKFGWTVPAGCTIAWGVIDGSGVSSLGGWGGVTSSTAPLGVKDQAATQTVGGLIGTIGVPLVAIVYGGGTAGTAQLQCGQSTTEAGNLKLNRGSAMEAKRLVA